MSDRNIVPKALLGILLILLCTGIGLRMMRTAVQEPKVSAVTTPEPTPEPTPEVHTAKLFMAGDGLLHGAVYKDAYRRGNGTYVFDEMMEGIEPIVRNYDLRYYNQESILGGTELGLMTYPLFNSPQEFGDTMVRLGFNLVSLANNHSLDVGETGIQRSMEYWRKQPGVVTAGTYTSFEEQAEIPVHEINGITYTFLSYTYGCNGLLPPAGKEYLVNIYPGHEEEMLEKVREADRISDVVMIAMHWGIEYSFEPSAEQRQLAQELAEAGADIIIGSHPHVIQPVERIGNAVCFYSFGNMISAQLETQNLTGLIAGLTITKTTDHGNTEITISDIHTDLIYTYYANHINFRLYPYDELNDSILPGYQEYYKRYMDIVTGGDETIQIGGMR